jgi:hypothetical protein
MATAKQWVEHEREEIASAIDAAVEWIEKNCTEDDLRHACEHDDWKWDFLVDLKDDLKERIKEHNKARHASLPKAERKRLKERKKGIAKLRAISGLERIAIEWADKVERANEALARNYTEEELETLIGVRWRECIWERMGTAAVDMAEYCQKREREQEDLFGHSDPEIRRQVAENTRNILRLILELAATPDQGLEFEHGPDWEKSPPHWFRARTELLRRREENGGKKLPMEQESEIVFEAWCRDWARNLNASHEERMEGRVEEPEPDRIN